MTSLSLLCFVSLDVINIFGVETILIYTALLLKKRVAVYSPKIEALLDICR